jgi:hypothetical protein
MVDAASTTVVRAVPPPAAPVLRAATAVRVVDAAAARVVRASPPPTAPVLLNAKVVRVTAVRVVDAAVPM